MDNANTIPPLKYHFNHIDGVTVIEKNSGMLTESEIEDVFIEKTLFDPSKIIEEVKEEKIIDKEEILKSIDERIMTIDDFLEEIDEK